MRMLSLAPHAVLALLLLTPAGAVLCADEPAPATAPPAPAPAQPSPAQRAAQVLAALPAPSAAGEWTFEGDVVVRGNVVAGTVNLSLKALAPAAGALGEQPTWAALEDVRIQFGKQNLHLHVEATLDRTLAGLKGKTESQQPNSERMAMTWQRTEKGYAWEQRAGDAPPVSLVLETPDALRVGMVGLIVFCRALPAAPAVYAVSVFDNEPKQSASVDGHRDETTLEVLGERGFDSGAGEVKAWVVRVVEGPGQDKERFVAFSPDAQRRLLGLRMPRNATAILPKGVVSPSAPEEVSFTLPAKTAKHAAVVAARAFALSDAEAMEKVVHWPTALARLRAAQSVGAETSDEALRDGILGRLRRGSPRAAAEMIEGALQLVAPQIKEEVQEDGTVRVAFGEMFRNLVLLVVKVEDAWYLAEFPAPVK